MVIGLLTLAAIPTTIGVAEGVSRRDEANKDAKDRIEQQMRKFNIECYCDSPQGKAKAINGGTVVLRNDKLYIDQPSKPRTSHPFEGMYIEYADNDRPKPLPLGMVSMVYSDPPTLNWIYVDKNTREVKYGNKTASKEHIVGPWSWEAGEEGGPGGVALDGEEGAVAIETSEGWEIRWEDTNGNIGVKTKARVTISLERKMLEPTEADKPTVTEPKHAIKTDSKTELTNTRFEDKTRTTDGQKATMVKVTGGNPSQKKREPKLEIASSSVIKPMREK
ncbi:uncharacterized protein KY384_001701 [Bacidia gigantensis]|uniref:uncharacterized protein n=1 Tax=Bacidia gigantensis TaxID=2732470 RepID=UPI001D044ACC|nr:uncharacterized protein KY384_001701 [Bacidia gigantensis]KAG8533959.1 hypothetical protein KY384_001701 [Bacidia gigantensis]